MTTTEHPAAGDPPARDRSAGPAPESPAPAGDLHTAAAQRLAQRAVGLLTVAVVLDYADRATLGAVAPAVRSDLGLSLAQLGYLGAAFGVVGGVSTVAAGVLVDRVPRMRLLGASALAWALAMLATGSAQTLLWLLLARSALAVVLATVGPAYPSIVGDAVPPERRGRALGIIDSGQLVGGALGVGIGALAVLLLSWRWAFFVLALPAVVLAVLFWRAAEPGRTGRPARASLRAVAVRLWHTPSAVLVLVSGAAASYYLAGASAFAVVFAVARYSVSTPAADLALLALGLGGLVGILLGGRASDRLSQQGRGARRLTLCGLGYLLAAVAWLPTLLVHSLLLALPLLLLGAAGLAATLPTLDAVRVDVIPAGLRGRTEAVRTLVRIVAEGGAPLVFGLIAGAAGGDDQGLQLAFLVTLPGIVVGGALLSLAARFYDRDRDRVLGEGST